MADISGDFIEYLKLYGDTSTERSKGNKPSDWSVLNSNDPNVASDANINAIITKHQKDFEIWKKCPKIIKNYYGGRPPLELLAKVANNPYCTDADAIKILAEYNASKANFEEANASSGANVLNHEETSDILQIPEVILTTSTYKSLQKLGIQLTKEHIESMQTMKQTLQNKGRSEQAAEILAAEAAQRKACCEHIQKILDNPNISREEKDKAKREHSELLHQSRENTLRIATKDILTTDPGRAAVRLLWYAQFMHRLNDDDTLSQLNELMQRIQTPEQLQSLAHYMNDSKYTKKCQDASKSLFTSLLESNGVDMERLNEFRRQDQRVRMHEAMLKAAQERLAQEEPERAAIRTLFKAQLNHDINDDTKTQVNTLVRDLIKADRLSELAVQMNGKKYERLTDETKYTFESILEKNGVDLRALQKLRQQAVQKDAPTQIQTSEPRPQSIQEKIQQLRGTSPRQISVGKVSSKTLSSFRLDDPNQFNR